MPPAPRQVDPAHLVAAQRALDGLVVGQEAAAQAVGDVAEPEVQAGRLDALGRQFALAGQDPALLDGLGDHLGGKHTAAVAMAHGLPSPPQSWPVTRLLPSLTRQGYATGSARQPASRRRARGRGGLPPSRRLGPAPGRHATAAGAVGRVCDGIVDGSRRGVPAGPPTPGGKRGKRAGQCAGAAVPQRHDGRARQALRGRFRRGVGGAGVHGGRAVHRRSAVSRAVPGTDQLPDAGPPREPVRAQLHDVPGHRPDLRLPGVPPAPDRLVLQRGKRPLPRARSPSSTPPPRTASSSSRGGPANTTSSREPPSSWS